MQTLKRHTTKNYIFSIWNEKKKKLEPVLNVNDFFSIDIKICNVKSRLFSTSSSMFFFVTVQSVQQLLRYAVCRICIIISTINDVHSQHLALNIIIVNIMNGKYQVAFIQWQYSHVYAIYFNVSIRHTHPQYLLTV